MKKNEIQTKIGCRRVRAKQGVEEDEEEEGDGDRKN